MQLRSTPLVVALAIALAGAPDARAQSPQTVAVGETQRRLDALEARLGAQQDEIARLRSQVDFLELSIRGRGVSDPQAPQVAAQEAPAVNQATQASAQDGSTTPQSIGQQQQSDDADRREKEKALVVQEHAPLFERRFTLDIGQSYSYYDRRQLALTGFLALDAIFLGKINLDQTKASVFTTDVTARYGLTERINLEANIPYVYRTSRFISGGAGGASSTLSEVNMNANGIGDASVAGYFQLVKESARWPDLVASLRVRAPTGRDPFGLKLIMPDENNDNIIIPEDLPTGSGVWSATASVSALRTYDPVILFGSIGYTYNVARSFDDISPVLDQVVPATVRLGNPFLLSGGLAIALNDRAAVSFGVSASIAGATHTKEPGGEYQRIPGSATNTATLNIGGSYLLPSGWNLNGQLASGLSPDAPNYLLSIRASRGF